MSVDRPLLACEELFLLLTRADGAKQGWGTQRGLGLTAALLADLAERGCLTVEGTWREVVRLRPADATGDALLEAARARLAGRDGKKVTSLVKDKHLAPQEQVGARLVAAEIVRHEPARMLGLVAAKWPLLDPAPEAAVRARLLRTVLGDGEGAPRDVTLLGVLHALGQARPLLGDEALGRRELGKRLKAFREASPFARAVVKVLQEQSAAAGAVAAGAAATSS